MHSIQGSENNLSLNDQLTVVVITHNRPAFLQRTLQYYSTLPCRVLVLDSSQQTNDVEVSFSNVDYHHLPQFAYLGLQEKVTHGVGLVTTPYMTFAPDDDFLMHDALVESVNFLAGNPDYSLCHGYCLMYLSYGNQVEYMRRDKKVCEDFSSEAPDRVLTYLDQYIPPFYAVTRTQILQDWYAALPDHTGFELQEFGHAFYLLARGKARILPIPYVVREANYIASDHQTDILQKICDPSAPAVAERQRFAEFLGGLQTPFPGLERDVLEQLVHSGYAALRTCLIEQRSLTLKPIFTSHWDEVFTPVRRMFGPHQFVEMPFYNQPFFDVLTQLEFLIHAMPAGKLQLQQLEGIWTRQENLLRLHGNDSDETIANRLWEAMALNIFNPHVISRLAAVMTEDEQASEVEQLTAWLARINAVRKHDYRERFAQMPSGRLLDWMQARQPSADELSAINHHLQAQGGGPVFGIFLLDLEEDMDKLQSTLDSLVEGYCKSFKVVVFTTGEPPTATSAQNTLHFVKVSKTNYIDKLNQVAQQSRCDWLLLAEAGDQFTGAGLLRASLELQAAPQCRAVYADEIQRQPGGALSHVMRPGLNLDLLQSHPAQMARHWLVRRDVLVDAGGYSKDFAQALEFELVLRLIEKGGLDWLAHLDEPLLICEAPLPEENAHERKALTRHLTARGYKAQVDAVRPGTWRIDYRHSDRPLVSIVLSSGDNLETLQRCLASVLLRTRYSHYEVLLVDSHSQSPEVEMWLGHQEQGRVRVIRSEAPLNGTQLINQACSEAAGDYLVLLSGEAQVVNANWIESLLNHAQRPEVGVVGAKFVDATGIITGAGLILGMNGGVGSAFVGDHKDAAGYLQRLSVEQNYSAVSGACMMVRKALYDEVGGLDTEHFAEAFSDVDLCLKIGQAGYLTVWTPQVLVVHPGTLPQAPVALAALQEKWAGAFGHDLAYNKNLALSGKGFTLGDATRVNWAQLLA